MRRMKYYDVIAKPATALRLISVRRRGVWRFGTLNKAPVAKKTENQTFYVINESFGLCNYDQRDPEKMLFRGEPGDYVALDKKGNLTLVKLADYMRRFPVNDTTARYSPPTSSDFIRETYKKEQQTDSNSSTINSTSTGGSANARPTNTGPSY